MVKYIAVEGADVMRETIYEGKSYPEPDYDVQKAVSVSGMNFFRYYPQDRLVIVAEVTVEKFSCKRFYPNMPYSFADDMVYDNDRAVFLDMFKAIDSGDKKSTSIFRLKDGFTYVRMVLSVLETDENKNVLTVVGMAEDVTDEIIKDRESKDRKTILEEQMAVVRGLSADYYSVMLVDYQKDTVSIKRAQKGDGKKMSDFFSSYPSWSEGIRAYTDTQVFDDKDAFYEALSREGLMNHAEDYSFKYKKITDDGYIYLKTKVTYAELEGYRIAVIGTENVDKENPSGNADA